MPKVPQRATWGVHPWRSSTWTDPWLMAVATEHGSFFHPKNMELQGEKTKMIQFMDKQLMIKYDKPSMISPSGAAGCTPASRRLRQNSNLPFFHHRDVGLWSNLSKSDLWVLPTFSDKPRFRWAMGQKVCWGFSKENQPAEDVIHNGWLIFTIWIY